MTNPNCLFCDVNGTQQYELITQNNLAYARWDPFPVVASHAAALPKRHVKSFFELQPEEVEAMYGLVKATHEFVMARLKPDGFTLAVDDGVQAGQLIGHVSLQVIPRFYGDVENARGGVRGVIPGKADY